MKTPQIGLLFLGCVLSATLTTQAQIIDNGDGTLLDAGCGRLWMKAPGPHVTKDQAALWADTLSFAGHTDWILPGGYDYGNAIRFGYLDLTQRLLSPFDQPTGDLFWTNGPGGPAGTGRAYNLRTNRELSLPSSQVCGTFAMRLRPLFPAPSDVYIRDCLGGGTYGKPTTPWPVLCSRTDTASSPDIFADNNGDGRVDIPKAGICNLYKVVVHNRTIVWSTVVVVKLYRQSSRWPCSSLNHAELIGQTTVNVPPCAWAVASIKEPTPLPPPPVESGRTYDWIFAAFASAGVGRRGCRDPEWRVPE